MPGKTTSKPRKRKFTSAGNEDYGAPAHLKIRSRKQLEALLLEGMQSPAKPMTKSDWTSLRRRLVEKHLKRKMG